MCHSILRDEHFQRRFADKLILVDGIADDEAALALSYGFKKVISLRELMSLEVTASPWIGPDL